LELADALKVNTSVTSLNLCDNWISRGVTALADALKVNSTLTEIDLTMCHDIDDEAVLALADALKVNTSLKSLYVRMKISAAQVYRRSLTR
jgi:hypothetical protein